MALDKGETALAEVAKRKAEQIESEALGKKACLFTFIEGKWEGDGSCNWIVHLYVRNSVLLTYKNRERAFIMLFKLLPNPFSCY